MEAEAERANTSSSRRITSSATVTKKKRKPLSDLTNLIPSYTIHKPYNSNSKPHKPGLNSSKSDSSIGSSNYNSNKNAPNPCTVPSSPHSSSAVPVNGDGDESELLAVDSRKLIAEKPVSKGMDVHAPFSCFLQEKAEDIGKALQADLVDLNFPPVKKTKDKGKAIAMSSTYSPIEKTKDKGKAIAGHFSYHSVEKTHDILLIAFPWRE